MTEFDRAAAILAEIATLDDDTTAQLAEITFTTQDDGNILAALRASLAEDYRNGQVDPRDLTETAQAVGRDVIRRGHHSLFQQLADLHRPDDIVLTTTGEDDIEDDVVAIDDNGKLWEAVTEVLAGRYARAALTLLRYLEGHADTLEQAHEEAELAADESDES